MCIWRQPDGQDITFSVLPAGRHGRCRLNNHSPTQVQISAALQIEKPLLQRERLFREQTCRQLNF